MDVVKHYTTKFKTIIYVLAKIVSYCVAFTILLAIIAALLGLPDKLHEVSFLGTDGLMVFISYVVNIIIAVELIHVLCHQTLDAIVEVLSLAITRELILEHMHTWEMLLGVAAIGLLFCMRKFLFIPKLDEDNDIEGDEGPRVGATAKDILFRGHTK